MNANLNISLRHLLNHFTCPFTRLHCVGNDANFTLRILLALAACPLKNEPLDSHQEELVKKLKTISYAPYPL